MNSTKVQWQIQFRTARDRAWRNRAGLFETRDSAREMAKWLQDWTPMGPSHIPHKGGYGFGNTRVVKYVKGQKP